MQAPSRPHVATVSASTAVAAQAVAAQAVVRPPVPTIRSYRPRGFPTTTAPAPTLPRKVSQRLNELYFSLCENGDLPRVRALVSAFPGDINLRVGNAAVVGDAALFGATVSTNVALVQWYQSTVFNADRCCHPVCFEACIIQACVTGSIPLLTQLMVCGSLTPRLFMMNCPAVVTFPASPKPIDKCNVFAAACSMCNMPVIEWMLPLARDLLTAEQLRTVVNSGFRAVCAGAYGPSVATHIATARWLYTSCAGIIDVHRNHAETFRMACGNGCLQLAEWLLSLTSSEGGAPLNLLTAPEADFNIITSGHKDEIIGALAAPWSALVFGHVHVVGWLYALSFQRGDGSIFAGLTTEQLHVLFEGVCSGQHGPPAEVLAAAQFTKSVNPTIDIHRNGDALLRAVCLAKLTPIARWLLSSDPTGFSKEVTRELCDSPIVQEAPELLMLLTAGTV